MLLQTKKTLNKWGKRMNTKQQFFTICEDAGDNYYEYVQKAKTEVIRWEFSKSKRYDLTPYWFERNIESPGALLDNYEEGCYKYGFNLDGKLCYCETWFEECYQYSDERVINRRYKDGKIDSIELYSLRNGQPEAYVEFIVRNGLEHGKEWYFEETYTHKEGMLQLIERNQYRHDGQHQRLYKYYLQYRDNRDLMSIKSNNGKFIYKDIRPEELTKKRIYILSTLLSVIFSMVLTWRTIIYEYDHGSLFIVYFLNFCIAWLIIAFLWNIGFRIAFFICLAGFGYHYYLLCIDFPLTDSPIDTHIYTLLFGPFIGAIALTIGLFLEGALRSIRHYLNDRV
jgi:hypothetical protein